MWFEPMFLSGSLAVFKYRDEPRRAGRAAPIKQANLCRLRRQRCSNYFQDSAPARNCQVRLARCGVLGDQIVGNFGRKNQLMVLF
jgi:hypothetical protein